MARIYCMEVQGSSHPLDKQGIPPFFLLNRCKYLQRMIHMHLKRIASLDRCKYLHRMARIYRIEVQGSSHPLDNFHMHLKRIASLDHCKYLDCIPRIYHFHWDQDSSHPLDNVHMSSLHIDPYTSFLDNMDRLLAFLLHSRPYPLDILYIPLVLQIHCR